jgi:hypothetical protein
MPLTRSRIMRTKRSAPVLLERLESRDMMAVLAFIDEVSGELRVQLGGEGDQATLMAVDVEGSAASLQRAYQISGTGITAPMTFTAAEVNGIAVTGATGGQSFLVASAGGRTIDDAMKVGVGVESTAIYGQIDTAGIVLIRSPEIVLGAGVRTAGEQVYEGQVLLDGDVVVDAGTAAVRFTAPINGIGDGRFQHGASGHLEVRSGAETFFGGPVGAALGLAGLSTDAAGTTTIAGGVVVTNGEPGQSYGDPVTLVANTVAASQVSLAAGAGPISFQNTLDGPVSITASTTGAISFLGAVGSKTVLTGLAITSADSVTAEEPIHLVGEAANASLDGITIGGQVNAVTLNGGGSITKFANAGIVFGGTSLNSTVRGFDIHANRGFGILVNPGDYTGTVIAGNLIRGNGTFGTVGGGTPSFTDGNSFTRDAGDGIRILGSRLLVGGESLAGNVITGNARSGITVSGATALGNGILGNSIFQNGPASPAAAGDGIRLENGGNADRPAVTIEEVTIDPVADRVRVRVSIPGATSGIVRVQLFANSASDATGLVAIDPAVFEGRRLVGNGTVVGAGPTTLEIPLQDLPAGDWLTATATGPDGSTSAFTPGVVVEETVGKVFAVGTAGSSVAWDREFPYTAVNATTIRIPGLPATQAGFFSPRMPLTITPANHGESKQATVVRSRYDARQRAVIVTLSQAIPTLPAAGTLVLGEASLPGARLVEATEGVEQREFGAADLRLAGYSAAFVTRFQGGLRVAAADINANGRSDLVVAPGGVPDRPDPAAPHRKLSQVFGTSLSTIAIFDGAVTPAWEPVAVDVGAVFPGGARDGYFVALGDCLSDAAGSGTLELIVAAGGRVAVFDIGVSGPAARPTIDPVPVRVIDLPPGQVVTSVATGRLFATGDVDDVVVASTTATQRVAGTTTVSILAGPTLETTRSFVVSSLVESGPYRRLVNVFGFGASLGVGDIDGDARNDLVLGAGANGLGNFRVLGGEFVTAASASTNPAAFAATIAQQLGPQGKFSQAPRQGRGWRPSGGPDFFTPGEVIGPTGMGFNAPVSVVVVNGLPGTGGRAQVFAALGNANQTANTVRRFLFTGPAAWTSAATFDLLPITSGNPRFRHGVGLRLG